jgi:hypothetical protein
MPERNEVVTGIGVRDVRAFLRDIDGMPKFPATATPGVMYDGMKFGGATALNITVPEANMVQVRGDDRVFHTFQLPPTESPSGELRVSKTDMSILAALAGINVVGSPPQRRVGVATDRQGLEPATILFGQQMAVDSDDTSTYVGQQVWKTYMLLNAIETPAPSGMEDQTPTEDTYNVTCNDAAMDEMGVAFTVAVHGYTKAPYQIITTLGRFGLNVTEATSGQTDFTLTQENLHADSPVIVSVNGTILGSASVSVAGNVVTIPACTEGDKVVIEFEYD